MTQGERITYWLYRHQRLLVALLILTTLFAAYQITKLGIDNSMDIWFLENDPANIEYQRFLDAYEHNEVMLLVVEDPRGFFDPDAQMRLLDLTLDLRAIEGITNTTSFLDVVPTETDPAKVINNTLVHHRMLSDNTKDAAIYLELDRSADLGHLRSKILEQIQQLMAGQGVYHLAGLGVIYEALNQIAIHQSATLFISTFVVVALLLWLMLRNLQTLMIILFISSVASTLLLGTLVMAGKDINIVTMTIPTLIFVISVSTCIHIFRKVSLVDPDKDTETRIIEGVGAMFKPVLISSLTSAIGFLALTTSRMQIIRDLGLFTSAGLIYSFISSVLLTVFFISRKHTHTRIREMQFINKLVALAGRLAFRFPEHILVSSLLLVTLSIYGITRLNVDTYTLEMLFDDHPVKMDSRAIEAKIGSYLTVEYVVRSDQSVFNDTAFQQVQNWKQTVVDKGLAVWSFAITDLSQQGAMVSDYQQLKLLSRLYGISDVWQKYVRNEHEVRVTFGIPMQSANSVAHTIHDIGALADMNNGVQVLASGYMPLYSRMMDYVVDTQVQSFGIAFIIIFLVIASSFRSLRMFLMSIPSNVLPILFVLGLMGIAGINLDTATVTIAAILIGLVVDDTIHFLHYYRLERRNYSTIDAIQRTMNNIGYSITLSSIAFSMGMAVLVLATVKSIVWFGLLIASGMLFAFIADMLVLPAILVMTDKRRIQDVRRQDG